jgi:hypothetical protein
MRSSSRMLHSQKSLRAPAQINAGPVAPSPLANLTSRSARSTTEGDQIDGLNAPSGTARSVITEHCSRAEMRRAIGRAGRDYAC